MQATPDVVYKDRQAAFAATADALARRLSILGNSRLFVFLLALVCGILGKERSDATLFAVAGALALGYIGLVVVHRRTRRAESLHRALARVNHLGTLRLERSWNELPDYGRPNLSQGHPYADDLDAVGRPGLMQLAAPPATAQGRQMLTEWFLARDSTSKIGERQAAVRSIAQEIEWRDGLAARGLLTPPPRVEDIETFLSWAESKPWLTQRPALVWAARVIPASALCLAALQMAGYTERMLAPLPLLAGLAISLIYTRKIHAVYDRAFAREGLLRDYPEILRHAINVPGDSARIVTLRKNLGGPLTPAHARLHALTKIQQLTELRLSAMMYMPIQLLTMWDFHVHNRLEAWQAEHGRQVRQWLIATAELDAISSLSAIAFDHPDWTMPIIEDERRSLAAHGLGHPMLRRDVNVRNDVSVGPPGTVLLITGSNMSGKSTLMRALGCNIVLAQAGAPVCADELRLPPVRLFCSGRIRDSLTDGVSLYWAELQRIASLVEAARVPASPILFYLLDEILHGTNTVERRVAASSVIEHLLAENAIGAVTTHDLALADEPAIAPAATLVHFTEKVSRSIDGITMDFDYRVRPGLATSTNALTLLEMLGLHRRQEA